MLEKEEWIAGALSMDEAEVWMQVERLTLLESAQSVGRNGREGRVCGPQ